MLSHCGRRQHLTFTPILVAGNNVEGVVEMEEQPRDQDIHTHVIGDFSVLQLILS